MAASLSWVTENFFKEITIGAKLARDDVSEAVIAKRAWEKATDGEIRRLVEKLKILPEDDPEKVRLSHNLMVLTGYPEISF
jgi:hypothetical protein